MSILSEIARLENAANSIATAITNKGVYVSSSTSIDEYADKINLIQAPPLKNLVVGKFAIAEWEDFDGTVIQNGEGYKFELRGGNINGSKSISFIPSKTSIQMTLKAEIGIPQYGGVSIDLYRDNVSIYEFSMSSTGDETETITLVAAVGVPINLKLYIAGGGSSTVSGAITFMSIT